MSVVYITNAGPEASAFFFNGILSYITVDHHERLNRDFFGIDWEFAVLPGWSYNVTVVLVPLERSLTLAAIAALALCAVGFAQNPATSVSVDANVNRLAINPNIYGVAYGAAADMQALNAPLNRWGGDSTSRYNWQIDAHSAGNDWYFETYSDGSGTPSGSADAYVATTRSANNGAEPLFTIPMIDYLANLGADRSTLEGFSVKKYGAQTATDPYNSDAGNGVSSATGKDITGNNPLDTGVANTTAIQQAWLEHFVSTFGSASTTTGIKYYILDNEPSLWYSTHRDVHPNPATYQEMYDKIVAYASTIRSVDPAAKIVGPEEWSWWAMYYSGFDQANGLGATSDYATHGNTYYYPWLLQQLYAYKQSTGTSLLDVLTVHCYNAIPDGSDDSLSGQQTRNQETRILWDPAFQDPSWYGDIGINGRVLNWIPTIKAMVSQYYPGLETGCTEYNWGDEPNLNGATTQADVLGIHGREGFDLATRWTVPANPSPTYLAMEMYRNYDGNLSTFGDTSVSDTVANPDNLSSFAAVRSSDGALTVMVINKQQGSTPVTVSLANFATTGTAHTWQISSASQTAIAQLADASVANNAIFITVPSQSITLFVIPAGSITSLPAAPTGLAAAVGSGTVTLTWNAAGGATSYTVKRGTKTGGPYTNIGTVTNPAPTSFADSGLTNGDTYYYVVAGTNSAGTGPDSAELAATPIVPPTFSSSASATPNPVVQGSTTAISATVTCTANTLQNGTVQIVALDPNGSTAASQSFTLQNFTTSQSHGYSLNLTPALAGTYTVEVGVFSSTGQSWSWNASAASITVNSSTTFTSTAAPSPSTIAPGGSSSIPVTVTETGATGLTNANVELQIFDHLGNAVATNVWSGQNFAAGQELQFAYTWTTAGTIALGTYSVDLGVFDSGWDHDYYWNTDATITVSATGPTGYTLTLAAAPSGAGSVTPNPTPTGGTYASGTKVCLTATPNAGWAFSSWSGSALDGSNCLVMNANASVTANFVPAPLRFIAITPCRLVDTRAANGAFGSPSLVAASARSFTIPNSTSCSVPTSAAAYSLNVTVVPKGALGYLTVWPTGQAQPDASTLNSTDGRVKANAAIIPAGTGGAVSVYATNATDLVLDIDGYFVPATDTSALAFYPLAPCRIADTRKASYGSLGTPAMTAGQQRTFAILSSTCSVPDTAQAYSLNFTAVPSGPLGFITALPTGQTRPLASTLNAPTGTVTANAAIVQAGTGGSVDVYASNATNLVIDINGYFAPSGTGGLSLYNLSPCRILDTRQPSGSLPFSGEKDVNVTASGCAAPSGAQAYVFNATVVPPAPLGYLTLWPQGGTEPLVSTLNALDGAITSNMAIVPTSNGSIAAEPSSPTQLILDIFGCFAP